MIPIERKQPGMLYLRKVDAFAMLAVAVLLVGFAASHHTSRAGRVKCSFFDTQAEAQKTFDSDRPHFASLDADHDGVACEALLKKH